MRTLVWFRGKDLRISDHAPLRDAIAAGEVIPLFVLDPYFFAPSRAVQLPHRMQFLLESLRELAASLESRGSRLFLARGKSVEVVPRLADAWRVDRVVAHRWVEPFGRERDRRIRAALRVPFDLYEGETLLPPGTARTGAGKPFSVFTPFARAFLQTASLSSPLPPPRAIPPPPAGLKAARCLLPTLESLGISYNARLVRGGERAAKQRLRRFLEGTAHRYDEVRNELGAAGTSRLSQDLKFGTLSVRAVWKAIESALGQGDAGRAYLNELLWREFSYDLLWNRPALLEEPSRGSFERFPWRTDERHWRAWVEGRTGYPVVDAAARQLLAEGFVHNRARMIAASFLTKHLMIDYRRGEAHYMKYLADGDWAANNAGWQWCAGCGSDAQPYHRIFSPTLQAERFDAKREYVRRWVPEMRGAASDYPPPIVDHSAARQRYLAAVRSLRGRSSLAMRLTRVP